MKILLLSLIMMPLLTFANSQIHSPFNDRIYPITIDKNFDHQNYFQPIGIVMKELCPQGVICVTDGTIIEISYSVDCSEKFKSFEYKLVETDSESVVAIINAVKESAKPAYNQNELPIYSCRGISLEKKTITVIRTQKENIDVISMGSSNVLYDFEKIVDFELN